MYFNQLLACAQHPKAGQNSQQMATEENLSFPKQSITQLINNCNWVILGISLVDFISGSFLVSFKQSFIFKQFFF